MSDDRISEEKLKIYEKSFGPHITSFNTEIEIEPKPGVYLLFQENELRYIGLSNNLKRRLRQHGPKGKAHVSYFRKQMKKYYGKDDSEISNIIRNQYGFKYILVDNEDNRKQIESYLIGLYYPLFNRNNICQYK